MSSSENVRSGRFINFFTKLLEKIDKFLSKLLSFIDKYHLRPLFFRLLNLRLFEYQLNKKELTQARQKYTSTREKTAEEKTSDADAKLNRLLSKLENWTPSQIGPPSSLPTKRLIRKDLQKYVDDEWDKGKEYLNIMKINTFASDGDGKDGLLVSKDSLKDFIPESGLKVPISNTSCTKPGVKLSFIHLSDVQLHDPRVYMFNKSLTDILSYFKAGFEHDPEMVFNDYSYYLTLIGIIESFKDRLSKTEEMPPSFMIHTGDALDMGVVSELYCFLYITNKLTIPWYNVLGNHDYQVYGNLYSKYVGVIDPNMGFQTVSSRYNFINMHGKGFEVDKQVYFSPENAPHKETTETGSFCNGFDRNGSESLENGNPDKPCSSPGYYYFEAIEPQPQNGDPGILIVVLDTSTKYFKFAKGTVFRHREVEGSPDESKRKEQIDWLENVLECYKNKTDQNGKKENWMVLAFGHHALDGDHFLDESYQYVTNLFNTPEYNVVAYFCGHTHTHSVKYRKNPNDDYTFGFWEITTDAIMEYPKKGSLVNVRCTDDGYLEITLQSFWPYFLEHTDYWGVIPPMLLNARRCLEASMRDRGWGVRKVDDYKKLDQQNHDVVLKFPFPKAN